MSKRWLFVVSIALIPGIPTSVLAGPTVIATGMIEQHGEQVCSVANVGTKPVLVDGMRVIDREGSQITTDLTSNCTFPGAISPGLACTQFTTSSLSGKARCEVRLSHGNAKSLRVTLETSDGGANRATSEGR
jgi:hypothetical protein